jgi:hypothetical protein
MMWHTHRRMSTPPSMLCHEWVECGHPSEWSQLTWEFYPATTHIVHYMFFILCKDPHCLPELGPCGSTSAYIKSRNYWTAKVFQGSLVENHWRFLRLKMNLEIKNSKMYQKADPLETRGKRNAWRQVRGSTCQGTSSTRKAKTRTTATFFNKCNGSSFNGVTQFNPFPIVTLFSDKTY